MSNISQYSTVSSNNNATPPDGWPENQSPSTVNDCGREMMAALAKWYGDTKGALATAGTGNAYTLTSNSAHAALADQSLITFRADRANTGAATLNVDSLGAKAIRANGSTLAADDIKADKIYQVAYNSTDDAYDLMGLPNNAKTTDQITLSERTSNTILGSADAGTLVKVTSGTFTQTFDPAATLGSGWFAFYHNTGSGDVTLDPDGSETIDGLTSFVMYPGESRLIQCDGSKLTSVVLSPFSKTFTSSGTFTKPPGYGYFGGLAWSGGASGGKNSTNDAIGGGGGGCFPFTIKEPDVSSSESVVIGAGGASVTASNTDGNVGGGTSFGSIFTVFGSSSYVQGGAIGVSSAFVSDAAAPSFEGATSQIFARNTVYGGANPSFDASRDSGSSIYGGAAGGSYQNTTTLRANGTSIFGGNGGAASDTGNGADGGVPAGGGGGTVSGSQSGAGGRGELRIWGIV